MIREAEVKKAFRLAYDTLAKCGEPEYTPEYLAGVLEMFKKTWEEDRKNELLKYLSIGICEWIGSIAKEESRK